MARRKGSLTTPPITWIRLLANTPRLHRVQMLWRRGSAAYRPLELDGSSPLGGDALDLPDTDIEWVAGSSTDREVERIEAIVAELWEGAIRWTRIHGEWCDFQLVGCDDDGEVLFEDGRRCRLADDDDELDRNGDDARGQESESARERERERLVEVAHWREVHQEHSKGLERIISYTRNERDDAVKRSKQTQDDTNRLWSQANEAVREAIEYQREQVQRFHEMNSGRIELKARAHAEMEKSARFARGVEFAKYGLDALISHGLPIANRLFDILGDRNMTVFPEFKRAQQAMAYLSITLTPTQLDVLTDKNREAATALVAVLDHASEMEIEPEALEYMAALIRIFRSERFRDVALPEQQLAARFIIGRLALYRMAEYGEVPTN
jgi:hypothetical protein